MIFDKETRKTLINALEQKMIRHGESGESIDKDTAFLWAVAKYTQLVLTRKDNVFSFNFPDFGYLQDRIDSDLLPREELFVEVDLSDKSNQVHSVPESMHFWCMLCERGLNCQLPEEDGPGRMFNRDDPTAFKQLSVIFAIMCFTNIPVRKLRVEFDTILLEAEIAGTGGYDPDCNGESFYLPTFKAIVTAESQGDSSY